MCNPGWQGTLSGDEEAAFRHQAHEQGQWIQHHSCWLQDSEAAWSRAIDLSPSNAAAWSNRGTVRLQYGYWQAAYEDLQEALKLEQQQTGTPSAILLNNLGNAEGALGHWPDAMQHYKAAADDADVGTIALANYALAAFETGDGELAIKSARQLLRRCGPLHCSLCLLSLASSAAADCMSTPASLECTLCTYHRAACHGVFSLLLFPEVNIFLAMLSDLHTQAVFMHVFLSLCSNSDVSVHHRDPEFLDSRCALTAFLWGTGRRSAAEDSWEQLQQSADGLGAALYSRATAVDRVRHRWPPRATAALVAFLHLSDVGQAEGYDLQMHDYNFATSA